MRRSTHLHQTSTKAVELLAPAGTKEAFMAALYFGADAIYFGVEKLNARRNAANIKLEDIPELADKAHLLGVRLYLTVNIIIKSFEMDEALKLIADAYNAGVDAFIIQDLGLLAEVQRVYPEVECHVSTQANVHDVSGVRFVESLGAKRVTTSRELSLEELKELCDTGVDIECFAHGAICISYSGQCLMSSLIGGCSANRGLCAQPCRKSYTLTNAKGKNISAVDGSYLLSPKDLSTIEILPDLITTGISSLKIEGRMKAPEYVGQVVKIYRKALDRALADLENYQVSQGELDALGEAFSRGFTQGYLQHERGNDFMSYKRPNNQGSYIGRVQSVNKGGVTLELLRPLEEGDLCEIRHEDENFVFEIDAPAQKSYQFKTDIKLEVGDLVYRLRNRKNANEVDEALQEEYSRLLKLDVSATLKLGHAARLKVCTQEGVCVELEGNTVEAARTKALSFDEVKEHIGRFGGTPFEMGDFSLELDPGIGMGFSALHKLRAKALVALVEELLEPWKTRSLEAKTPRLLADVDQSLSVKDTQKAELSAYVKNLTQASCAKNFGIQKLYADISDVSKDKELFGLVDVIVLSNVVHEKDFEREFDALESSKRYLVSNVSQISELNKRGIAFEISPSIPAINESILALFESFGPQIIWISPEMTLSEISRILKKIPVSAGIKISGREQVMTTEHCVLMSMGPCDENCPVCVRRKSPKYFTDQKGYSFPIITNDEGRSEIFNSIPLDLSSQLDKLLKSGVKNFVCDVRLLHEQALEDEMSYICKQFERAQAKEKLLPKRDNYTMGHIKRGII